MSDIQQLDPQPKPVQELYRTIQPLTDERRLEAQERARALVVKAAGAMPERKTFDQHTESKYPPWMNGLINALCLVVLMSAFAPSAIRLYAIGSTTFSESIDHETSANVAGISIVIMAELSMVLFSIASVVIEAKAGDAKTITDPKTGETKTIDPNKNIKRLLSFSQFIATVIALVGNGQVSLPGHEGNLFAWIEAFTPSIVVFTTATILKAQLLNAVERRHANTRAYQMALNVWKIATSQTETDPRYRPALNNALRDYLREDNGKGIGATARREYMAGFVLMDWQRLVKRELMADEWYTDPDALSVAPMPVQTTTRQTADIRQRVYAPVSSVTTDSRRHDSNRHVSYADAMSVQTDEDTQPTDIRQSGAGFVRVATAVEIARQWFIDNPGYEKTPLRELESLIGVGKDSIAKARKEITQ